FQPVDTWMFEDLADAEVVQDTATVLDDPARFEGVFLRRVVEIALLEVPLGHAATWVLGAHLQVERNGNVSLLADRVFLRAAESAGTQKDCCGGHEGPASRQRGVVHECSFLRGVGRRTDTSPERQRRDRPTQARSASDGTVPHKPGAPATGPNKPG